MIARLFLYVYVGSFTVVAVSILFAATLGRFQRRRRERERAAKRRVAV